MTSLRFKFNIAVLSWCSLSPFITHNELKVSNIVSWIKIVEDTDKLHLMLWLTLNFTYVSENIK